MDLSPHHDALRAEMGRRLRSADAAVRQACSFGTLIRWGVGVDPDGVLGREYWARATFLVGGLPSPTGQPWMLTVEGFRNGPDAADALAERLDEWRITRALHPTVLQP